MHEVADSGIGNESGSNAFLLEIVCELNAESEKRRAETPFARKTARCHDNVETLEIAAGEEKFFYDTRHTVS